MKLMFAVLLKMITLWSGSLLLALLIIAPALASIFFIVTAAKTIQHRRQPSR